MNHLIKYKKFESSGDAIPENDESLILLQDLSLSISDMGYDVIVKGYESYGGEGEYITYDIIIESRNKFIVYDINKDNIKDLDKITENLEKQVTLNQECLDIIQRSIKSGLYLNSYEATTSGSKTWSFIRFEKRKDGGEIIKDEEFIDEEEFPFE